MTRFQVPFLDDRSGSIAMLFALVLPVLIGASAFAVDLGSAYLERRTLQMSVDAAAMAAAQWPERADAVIRKILDDNSQRDATYQIVMGFFADNLAVDVAKRFTPSPTGNAVRVTATRTPPVYFAKIFGITTIPISVTADAVVAPVTALSVGSRLVDVNPTLLNSVLTPLTGLGLNLSVMDYQSLAKSEIALGPLLNAVVGKNAAATTTVSDVLAQPIKLSVLLAAISNVQLSAGDLVGSSVLKKAGQRAASADISVVLGDIIQIDEGLGNTKVAYPGTALESKIGALGLLNAAILGKPFGNDIQSELTVPGIAKTTIEMMIGESEQTARTISVSEGLPSVQTSQLRMRAEVQTTGILAALGTGLNLPIELVAAGGTATVTSTTCSEYPSKRSVTVSARPGVVKLAIGKFVGPLKSANTQDRLASTALVSTPIARITGSSYVSIAQPAPTLLTFRGAEIGNGTIKTANTTGILSSLVGSLLGGMAIDVDILGIGLPIPGLKGSVTPLLTALVQPLDDLLSSTLAVAGVSLGELDVRVDSLVCNTPKLIL